MAKPVSLAPETERNENFEVARLWVRVNLLEELPTRIVSGFNNGCETEISVSYPWLPSKCQSCGKYGHEKSSCSNRPAKGDTEAQVKNGREPRPVRSRSRGSKGRSTSRPGRTFYGKRMENFIYRVKEPKQNNPISEGSDHKTFDETIIHDSSPVKDTVEEDSKEAGSRNEDDSTGVRADEGSNLKKEESSAALKTPPAPEQ